MATTVSDSSDAEPSSPHGNHTSITNPKTLDETTPIVDYVVEQAQFYQKALDDAIESAVEASKSGISQIRSTSSDYYNLGLVIFLNIITCSAFQLW